MSDAGRLLSVTPVRSLGAYLEHGDGDGLGGVPPPTSKARTPQRASPVPTPRIADLTDGVVIYDPRQDRQRPDWTCEL